MTAPTERQLTVYEWLVDYFRVNHRPPTVREIANGMGFKSPNGAMGHLNALEAKGLIAVSKESARGIRLTANDGRCPCCGERLQARNAFTDETPEGKPVPMDR